MKVIKIIFVCLFVLFILLGIGVVVAVKTFNIDQYRERIAQAATDQLGRKVGIGKLAMSVSLTRGIRLHVNRLMVEDRTLSPQGIQATVEGIELQLSIDRLLKKREVAFSKIQILRPEVKVDLARLLADGDAKGPGEGEQPSMAEPVQGSTGRAAVPANLAVIIDDFSIQDGRVEILPDGKTLAVPVVLDQIVAGVKGFSLTDPSLFSLTCRALGVPRAIDIQGEMRVDAVNQQLSLKEVTVGVDLSKFSWADIVAVVPAAAEVRELKGQLSVRLNQALITAQGVPELDLKGSWTNGEVALKSLPQKISGIEVLAEYNQPHLQNVRAGCQYAGGTIAATGNVRDVVSAQRYDAVIELRGVRLQDLGLPSQGEMSVAGGIDGTVSLRGEGLSPEKILAALTADGGIQVSEMRLQNFNVLRSILSQMSMIPGLADQVQTALPARYSEVLERNDTLFQGVAVTLGMRDGTVSIPSTEIGSDVFVLNAAMSVTLEQVLAFQGKVRLPADISRAVLGSVPQLKALVNAQGEIVIPLAGYSGPAASFRPMPDLAALTKVILIDQGKDQLKDALKGIFGQKPSSVGGEGEAPASSSEEGVPQPETRPVEEQVVDKIFGTIFQ